MEHFTLSKLSDGIVVKKKKKRKKARETELLSLMMIAARERKKKRRRCREKIRNLFETENAEEKRMNV